MATQIVEPERIRRLNDRDPRSGRYVLYWMQQSQRARFNPALEHAVRTANDLGVPLVVGFGLVSDYPEANRRHYRFLLEGLVDVDSDLSRREIPFVVRMGSPPEVALKLAEEARAVVCDRGYLRHQVAWRDQVAEACAAPVIEVEGDAVVPIHCVSNKLEYAARTIRPKVHEHLDRFLVHLRTTALSNTDLESPLKGVSLADIDRVLDELGLDDSVPAVTHRFRGGTHQAVARMNRFRERLKRYSEERSEPALQVPSELSPYLHFGQISPVELALELGRGRYGKPEDREEFIEELVVRRTLSQNYVAFEPEYDEYRSLPEWARKTLDAHRDDERPSRYTKRELETASTDDPYWNAAMREMRYTGYMHNHMRMYWGKKILEWCNTPEYAFRVALELNNRYFLDGRDANSYANVAWLFGRHDRPWPERPVFGTVRSMSASGLERKTDIEAYVARVDKLVEEARSAGVRFE